MTSLIVLYLSTVNSINKYFLGFYFIADPVLNAEDTDWARQTCSCPWSLYKSLLHRETKTENPRIIQTQSCPYKVTLWVPSHQLFCKNKNPCKWTKKILRNEIDIWQTPLGSDHIYLMMVNFMCIFDWAKRCPDSW